jgi:hypothetical protein
MSRISSKKFDRPLRVELRASRHLLLAGLGLYLAAALACWWAPASAALLAVLVVHFAYLYCSHIQPCLPSAICALSWDPVRGWRIRQVRGDWLDAEPVLPVFVTRRLVVAQRCAADDFRRLRVRLIQSSHGDRNRAKVPGA